MAAKIRKGDKVIVYEVADPKRSARADEQWQKTPRARRGKLSGPHAERTASDSDEVDASSGPVTKPAQVE